MMIVRELPNEWKTVPDVFIVDVLSEYFARKTFNADTCRMEFGEYVKKVRKSAIHMYLHDPEFKAAISKFNKEEVAKCIIRC